MEDLWLLQQALVRQWPHLYLCLAHILLTKKRKYVLFDTFVHHVNTKSQNCDAIFCYAAFSRTLCLLAGKSWSMNVNDKISLLQPFETSLHPFVCLSFSGYPPSFKACQSIKLSGQECQIGFGLPQGLSQTFRLLQSVWMQTWDLSKNLHDQILGPKILHTKINSVNAFQYQLF